MTLWREIRARRDVRQLGGVDAYAQLLNSGYPYGGGFSQTLTDGRATEGIGTSYAQLAGGGYANNDVVFSCMAVRQHVFSAIRFQWQRIRAGRPSDLFGSQDLMLLEEPWPGGTTQDLLARMIQDADLAGNSYWTVDQRELVRLRPDWVDIVLEPRLIGGYHVGFRRIGYLYYEGGKQGSNRDDPAVFSAEQVAHFAPLPDPLANWRGMSWLTPVVREIEADALMTRHKRRFFDQGATPNLVVKHPPAATPQTIKQFRDVLDAGHAGVDKAYKTLHLGGGADVTVVGRDLQQLDFRGVQGHSETRVAAAAGVPPIIVGLSEGLQAATYCLPADELVWTVGGPRPIAELSVGDQVWSHVDGGLAPRRVTWWGRTGEKQIFTVRTKNRSFRATDNHPVLVRVPGSMASGASAERHPTVEWRAVGELRPGDCVVQVMELPDAFAGTHTPTGEATLELMQWLGAYLGDGSGAGHPRGCISIAMPPADRGREHYEALTGRLFPEVSCAPQPRSFRFNSVQVARWLADIGFAGRATTKRIPQWVFTLRRDLRLAFLAGLVDTDGSVDRRGSLKIQLANRHLVEQVKALAVSCGLQVSNLHEQIFKADVLPIAGRQATYVSWAVTVSSATDVAQIPFADPLYRQRVMDNYGRQRRGGKDAAKAGLDAALLGFFTVREIEPGPVVPVFDIGVDQGQSFVAGGVVVHNSNYAQARRRFADGTMHPLWQNAAGSLGRVVPLPRPAPNAAEPAPGSVRLFYDARDVAFLREDEKDAAAIAETKARTIRTYVDGGYTPESAKAAVESGDEGLLEHTGWFSVQLQRPGGSAPASTTEGQD